MGRVCLILLLLFVPWRTAAADETSPSFAVEASLSAEQAHPGEVVDLLLKFRLPQKAKLSEKPHLTGLEGLTILSTRPASDGLIIKIMVDTLDSLQIPALTLSFAGADGQEQKIMSNPVQLKVVSALKGESDALDVKSIKGIVPVGKNLWHNPWLYMAAGLAALVAFGIGWIAKKQKKKATEVLFAEPPDTVALKALGDLKLSGLFEKGDIKAYYFALSEIVRKYMEGIRFFPAYEYTTDEIAASTHHKEDLKVIKLLRHADLIKFAGHRPTRMQKEEDWEQVRRYVETTREKGDIAL
jgi:hypothetical protein